MASFCTDWTLLFQLIASSRKGSEQHLFTTMRSLFFNRPTESLSVAGWFALTAPALVWASLKLILYLKVLLLFLWPDCSRRLVLFNNGPLAKEGPELAVDALLCCWTLGCWAEWPGSLRLCVSRLKGDTTFPFAQATARRRESQQAEVPLGRPASVSVFLEMPWILLLFEQDKTRIHTEISAASCVYLVLFWWIHSNFF